MYSIYLFYIFDFCENLLLIELEFNNRLYHLTNAWEDNK